MNDMESPKASKLMIRMVLIAALAIIVAGAVFYRSLAAIPFAFGVLITSGLNIIKLRMLLRTIRKVVYMEDPAMGKNVVRLQYLLRYILTGAVLVAVGLIHNYTTPPPFYSSREAYFGVWAALFPNGPQSLLSAPLISIWGALAGIFTLQLSLILVRSMKLEKDGDTFIEYTDDDSTNEENANNVEKEGENVEKDDENSVNS